MDFSSIESRRLELLEQRMGGGRPPLIVNNLPMPSFGKAFEIIQKETELIQQLSTSDSEIDQISKEDEMPGQTPPDEAVKTKKKRKNYTQEEDSKIQEGYKQFGSDFEKIVKHMGIERTPNQIKDRWRRLNRNKNEEPPHKRRKTEDGEKTSPQKERQDTSSDLESKLEKDRMIIEVYDIHPHH
eukprot:TRINITY_DN2292_c0_g1_i2.p1 TRINITY_DN2292_c0_g1~~TRINITY_DN2292_c0_g1_i2.p1  ORF type:complete len:184 (+),score=53.71 TRINITY_DN2292_c0_g1_i2:134-685(+)